LSCLAVRNNSGRIDRLLRIAAPDARRAGAEPRVERRHLERSLAWLERLPPRREVGFAAAGG